MSDDNAEFLLAAGGYDPLAEQDLYGVPGGGVTAVNRIPDDEGEMVPGPKPIVPEGFELIQLEGVKGAIKFLSTP